MDHISIHFKGEEDFVKRIFSIIESVNTKQTFYLTEFLSPYHQSIVRSIVHHDEDLKVEFDGGIENAEMQRCLIAPHYFTTTKADFKLKVFEIMYSSKFETLRHGDVLGALMSIGIKRELFGDIVLNEGAYFACDESLERLLEMELTSIRHAKVKIKSVEKTVTAKVDYTMKTFFVKSFRLDLLLAAFYHLSRSEVNQHIQAGFVKVNHKEVVENHFLCNNNDVISFKQHGRVKLVDAKRTTKQGNRVVEGYFYK